MKKAGAKASKKSLYSVHPGVAMVQKWLAELPEKTGRSLEQWVKLIEKSGPPGTKERREWLKQEYKLGTNSAMFLVDRSEGRDKGEEDSPENYLKAAVKYVDEMFSGPKAALRPIYDELLKVGLALAPDVKVCPCKSIVPLYRNHVFAQIKPTTRTRIDLGFALKGVEATARLIDTGGAAKNDRITHRIGITSVDEIDDEVHDWLRVAYDRDA